MDACQNTPRHAKLLRFGSTSYTTLSALPSSPILVFSHIALLQTDWRRTNVLPLSSSLLSHTPAVARYRSAERLTKAISDTHIQTLLHIDKFFLEPKKSEHALVLHAKYQYLNHSQDIANKKLGRFLPPSPHYSRRRRRRHFDCCALSNSTGLRQVK